MLKVRNDELRVIVNTNFERHIAAGPQVRLGVIVLADFETYKADKKI